VTRPMYIAGLDLGQVSDSTGLIVAEVTTTDGEHQYDVQHIERVPLGTRYPNIVDHACATMAVLHDRIPRPALYLAVDQTGVGRAVGDMLVQANPLVDQLALITITGADLVNGDAVDGWRVPKRDLVSVVQVLLQTGRLRIANQLPMATELTNELLGFRVKISLAGHDSYGAGEDWRSAPHDDLVLALALACWFGETMLLSGPVWWTGDAADDW
jgi:hypothetical protein